MEPEEEHYDIEFLREQTILEEERRIRMEAEWQEAEHYKEQLPARIIVEIKTPEKHESTRNI